MQQHNYMHDHACNDHVSACTAQPLQRRRWLLAGASWALGASVGAGMLGCSNPQPPDPALQAFWDLQLPSMDGQMHRLHQYRGQGRGRPLLVNFWATWCPPCVRELPLLDQFAKNQGPSGVQVLGIAADRAANVTQWLQRQPLSYPVLLAETGGVALVRELGNPKGGLPFSMLFDGAGVLKQRRIGEFSDEILQRWVASI